MKIKISIFYILVNLLLCYGNLNAQNFKKEIPMSYGKKPDFAFTNTQAKSEKLGLQNIVDGYDSLEIRIWMNPGMSSYKKLFTLQRFNNTWEAKVYSFVVNYNKVSKTEDLDYLTSMVLSPKSGWQVFTDSLNSCKITMLPNMEDLPGLFEIQEGGDTFDVEVATKSYYRFFSYHIPEKYKKSFVEAKNMVAIIDLLKSEFNINYKVRY